MKLNLLSFTAAACLLSASSNFILAQAKPDWEASPAKRIAWQKSTTLGSVLISSTEGLACFDNIDGKAIWERTDLKGIQESVVEEISGSPFIVIGVGKIDFVNLLDGKTVFSSAANNYTQITQKQFLYQSNTILITGYKTNNKKVCYSMIDMSNGKELWSKEKGEFQFYLGCFSADKKDIIVATIFDVSRIDAKTGKEVWKKAASQNMKDASPKTMEYAKSVYAALGGDALTQSAIGKLFLSPNNPDQFFVAFEQKGEKTQQNGLKAGGGFQTQDKLAQVGYVTKYNCFNIKTGDFIWDNAIEINGHMAPYYATSKGLAIPDNLTTRINIYDYKTGKASWGKKGKGVKMAGEASFIIEMNKKLIVSSFAIAKSRINVYNLNDGSSAYDEKVDKISGGVTQLRDLEKGILVVTSEGDPKRPHLGALNMLNIATGQYYFQDEIKSNQDLITEKDDDLYIYDYEAGNILILNKKGSAVKKMNSAPIKFQGKEVPNRIEANADGIFLSSDQNLALINYKGKVVFQKYYEAPSESGFMNALHIASAVYATTVAVAATMGSVASAATVVILDDTKNSSLTSAMLQPVYASATVGYAGLAVDATIAVNQYMSKINQRFKATSTGNDFVVILHRNAEKKNNLMIVSKKTGELVKQIDISKDKKPNYSVDYVDKALYYIPQNSDAFYNKERDKVQCYKF